MSRDERSTVLQLLCYPLGAILAAVATAVRFVLDPWLGDTQTLSLLFAAIALAVWIAGTGPAIFTAALGYAASDYLFIPPRGEFAVLGVSGVVAICTYLFSSAAIIGFGAGMRAANRRARSYAHSLEEKTAEVQLGEKRKDEFLSILAHELRNPLAPIRNAVHLMIPRSPELDTARDVIDRQSRHLQRMIEDLSDLSRIRTGLMRLQRSAVRLDSVVNDAIVSVRPLIESRGHSLQVSLPEAPIVVDGDSTRLAQVFTNLLANAARYTPTGGTIRVEVRREAAEASVSVADTGMGIPAEMLPRVFEMYLQLNRAAERRGEGLGIGLAIVQRIVTLHGGTIEARSAGEGLGSDFIVRLPALTMRAAELEYPPPDGPVAPTSAVEAPAVLIVCKSEAMKETLSSRFGQKGLQVHVAHSESEAVRAGSRAQPCAVVAEFDSAAPQWRELCKTLRQYAWGDRALIVGVCTGMDDFDPLAVGLDHCVGDLGQAVELVDEHCVRAPLQLKSSVAPPKSNV